LSASPPAGTPFEVRRVGFGEAVAVARDALAPLRAAPLRLIGLFLLLWIPIQLLVSVPTLGLFLREAVAAVAFAGLTVALDAARRSDPPDFHHLGVVLRFPPDKLALLVLSAVLPMLAGVVAVALIWGYDATVAFVDALGQSSGHPSADMVLGLRVAAYLAGLPFTFVLPVWSLYGWSGSRSMGANLLVCLVNWRWVLAMTAVLLAAQTAIDGLYGLGAGWDLVSLLCDIAVQLLSLSWTLALARRALPA
jgi:hypothetical protein